MFNFTDINLSGQKILSPELQDFIRSREARKEREMPLPQISPGQNETSVRLTREEALTRIYELADLRTRQIKR